MKSFIKRGMSGLLAFLMCFTALFGAGSTTAFAASETSESYMISFPRDGDANQVYGTDTWGHPAKNFMNGWYTEENTTWTVHAQESFEGQVCYCIEPGVHREIGDTYSGFGENFWDNYPSSYNNTIEPDTIKVLLGRIMQYGYQGNVSTGWRSQNDADADKLAHDMATQILVWETVIGERDAEFNHVDTGGKDTAKSCIAPGNPLYSRFCTYYDSMVASVKSHTVIPSFMARSSGKAQSVELAWNGSEYTATLTDTNNVLSKFTFSSDMAGLKLSVNGNKLTITSDTAPTGAVAITAEKGQLRSGVLVWSDSKYGPSGGIQDVITYSATVSDPVKAFLNVTVSYGGLKIVKTSEDEKVSGITFTVKGNGVDENVTSDKNLKHSFENTWSDYGVPYLDEACVIGQSNNLVIYGHHMSNGSMFCDLELYSDPAFCMEHPVIRFDTLSSFGEYEVIAVFRYNTNQETFRYDREVNMDETRFSWFMEQVHARELFSTGKDASFGDQMLTLSTCEYTYKNGRLVVVARKVVQ